MLEKVHKFSPAPGSIFVGSGKQTAHGDAEDLRRNNHKDEGNEESRDTQSNEGHEGKEVISHQILVGSRVDAYGYCDYPAENKAAYRDNYSKAESVPD